MTLNLEVLSIIKTIPPAAFLLFLILAAVLAVELWRWRPKRKLPPIPPSEERPPTKPSIQPTPEAFRPLTQRQILTIALLLVILAVIPLSVILIRQTQEARRRIAIIPTPSPIISPPPTPRATPIRALFPTPSPRPKFIASPSAAPGKLAKLPATPTPRPTVLPTPTPSPLPKGAVKTPSPTPTEAPSVKKPKELPPAASPIFGILVGLFGTTVLFWGIKRLC